MTLSNETIILSVPVGTGGGGAAIVVAIVVVADGRADGAVVCYHCRESWGEVKTKKGDQKANNQPLHNKKCSNQQPTTNTHELRKPPSRSTVARFQAERN